MNTKEISNGMSYNEVKNMFGQVMEQLEDLGNKQPSAVEVDLTPITEKLNRILNKPEVRDFTEEQKTFLMDLLGSLFAQVAKKFPIYTKLNEIGATIKKLSEAEQPKTIHHQHRHIVGFQDMKGVLLIIFMLLTIFFLSSALYTAKQPNYRHIDNDLKYRYIKMKGEATPKQISELNKLFYGDDRDYAKIRQMRKDVEKYEQAVNDCAANMERARLHILEAGRLDNEVNKLKQGK